MKQTPDRPGEAPVPAAVEPAPWELPVLLLGVAIFLAVNLLTGLRYPTLWVDEDAYSDPAINLLIGRGFTSSAWPGQPLDHFWAGNVPLFQLLLSGWLRIFGISLAAARALNPVLMSGAVLVLWLLLKRLGSIASAPARLAALCLSLLGMGVTFATRSVRPDSLTILLFLLAVLAGTIRSAQLRLLALVLLGALFPWAGLQLAIYAFVFSCLLMAWSKGDLFKECAACGVGILLGLAGLFALYSQHGVWREFLVCITRYKDLDHPPQSLVTRLKLLPDGIVGDRSFALLLAVATIVGVVRFARGSFHWRSAFSFGLLAGYFVPLALCVIGKYPFYYSWMAVLPLSFGLMSAFPPECGWTAKLCLGLGGAAALLAVLYGWPLRTAFSIYEWHSRDYAPVEALARQSFGRDQWIFSDYSAYFAIKETGAVPILAAYTRNLSQEEKGRIMALFIRPDSLAYVQSLVGGDWVPGAVIHQPARPAPFGCQRAYDRFRAIAQQCDYDLQVFRRVDAGRQ